jgi:hypothetical protein
VERYGGIQRPAIREGTVAGTDTRTRVRSFESVHEARENTDGVDGRRLYTPSVQPDAANLEPLTADVGTVAGATIISVTPSNTTPATDAVPAAVPRSPADPASVREAQRIAERIARDETLADEARERYRKDGLPVLEPSALLGLLNPGERLHAVHRMAMLETGWRGTTGSDPNLPRGGTLYVTSQRLFHRGTQDGTWSFGDVDEMAIALERLLLVRLRDGSDLAIEVDQPRLLRVQLAAALAASRNAELEPAR